MIVLKGNNFPGGGIRDVVLTIGVFDGVHIGHREILNETTNTSMQKGFKSLVITLYPDPEKFLDPSAPFTVLTPLSKKLSFFEEFGFDYCFILEVNRELLQLEGKMFFEEFIFRKFYPKEIIVGEDFRFGRGREGDVSLLKELSKEYNFHLKVVPLLEVGGEKVSSSRIRQVLVKGDIESATFMLGRYPEVKGKVVRGEGRGKGLGFPTANIVPEHEFLLLEGVYLGSVDLPGEGRRPALLYVGTTPTFGGKFLRYEIYIPNFHKDLYGKDISFIIQQRLRGEMVFKDKEEIKRQLEMDSRNLVRYLSSLSRT